MATAALAREDYRPDTKIVDVEDPPFRPRVVEVGIEAIKALETGVAVGRVPTGELAVHVIVDGWRHRRHANARQTSCKEHELHAAFAVPMREEIVHPLSRDCGCFTKAEIEEADEDWRKKYGTEPPR